MFDSKVMRQVSDVHRGSGHARLPHDPEKSDHPLSYCASEYISEHILKGGGVSDLQRELLSTFAITQDEYGQIPMTRALSAGFEGTMH